MRIFDSFFKAIKNTPLQKYAAIFQSAIEEQFNEKRHPELATWLSTLADLPQFESVKADLKNTVKISSKAPLSDDTKQELEQKLRTFIPWRKGPFTLFDIEIDTEWRSDWKWDRVLPHIQPLKNKNVLDVGCGSGYHCWRMLGEDAKWVLGVDPSPRFVAQFEVLKHYLPTSNAHVIPLGLEQLPSNLQYFDTTFSMGVLYHRTSPIDHLKELRNTLKPGGQLILETLVVDGELGYSLMPKDRYAMMKNVWYIPSVPTLIQWLERCGFANARCVDLNQTSLEEQRSTTWMPSHSLKEFLDPNDINLTVEGYPAPMRAVIVCERRSGKAK